VEGCGWEARWWVAGQRQTGSGGEAKEVIRELEAEVDEQAEVDEWEGMCMRMVKDMGSHGTLLRNIRQ
jgi:hypothetical protein